MSRRIIRILSPGVMGSREPEMELLPERLHEIGVVGGDVGELAGVRDAVVEGDGFACRLALDEQRVRGCTQTAPAECGVRGIDP